MTAGVDAGSSNPGGAPGRIAGAWRQGALDVVLSHHLLDELLRVLPRLSRLDMTPADISAISWTV